MGEGWEVSSAWGGGLLGWREGGFEYLSVLCANSVSGFCRWRISRSGLMYREFKVRFFVREDRSWPTWSGWVSSEVKIGVKGGGLTDIEQIGRAHV